MLEEHKLIVEALRRLMQAAQEDGLAGFARLARKMILHAQTEEEILYPASILVGDYLRLKLGELLSLPENDSSESGQPRERWLTAGA